MEFNSNEMESNETRLCSGCQKFFGGKDTNYMCSLCFKNYKVQESEKKGDSSNLFKNEVTQNLHSDNLAINKFIQDGKDIFFEKKEAKIVKKEEVKTEAEPKQVNIV